MAYEKPYINASGLHIPLYTDIRDDLVSRMQAIYGQDIYLEPDSQDYQMLSAFADKVSDTFMLLALIYNNRGAGTAVGAGLDGIVKVNGIRRKGSSHSIAVLEITGTPGTVIYNGKAGDGNGIIWTMSGAVTVPDGGIIKVQATCDAAGTVYADANTINRIMAPTQGWLSVTNPAKATVGQDEESDASLRSRQAISVARPSRTVLLGTMGGIAELDDVTRYRLYENYTDTVNEHGIPGHSICAVVEGGDECGIAKEIYYRKTPGCGTYGDIEVLVTEEMEQYPIECPPMRFFRPRYIQVYVAVKVSAKAGFVEQTRADIINNVVDYLNSLKIGSNLVLSALYAPINYAASDITNPSFSVESLLIGKTSGSMGGSDIPILFNEVTQGVISYVTVEVT